MFNKFNLRIFGLYKGPSVPREIGIGGVNIRSKLPKVVL